MPDKFEVSSFMPWLLGILVSLMVVVMGFQEFVISELHATVNENKVILGKIPIDYVQLNRFLRESKRAEEQAEIRNTRIDGQMNCIAGKVDRLVVGHALLTGKIIKFQEEKKKK